jgi:hypothetical protein
MATRYNSKSLSRFGVVGINATTHQGTPDLTIPPVGIEDVDTSIFKLFEKEILLQVSGENSSPKKVPVIFAAGEKWALLKKKRALRDRNNSLILPLVTIARNSVSQDMGEDITGRGINQQTGEIVIRRRLDKSDRGYQNLINRYLLRNQKNVATNPSLEHVQGQILTDKQVGEDKDTSAAIDGAWLADIKHKNIYETIVIPTPQFCTVNYEITMWTQYTQHMNQLLEQVISSFLPQGNAWKLDTPKGYWFIATVDNNSYDPENNVDNMYQEERIIKYKFSVNVKAYIFASQHPGIGVPIKRYVSSPIITFDTGLDPNVQIDSGVSIVGDPFLGSDDPTLPLSDTKSNRVDQRRSGTTLYDPHVDMMVSADPALASRNVQQNKPLYTKIISQNAHGQTLEKFARVYKVNKASGETVIKLASEIDSKPSPDAAESLLGGLTYDLVNDI